MAEDPYDDPSWQEFAKHVQAHLIPMISSSAVTAALVGKGDAEVRQAVELGMTLLMEKPLLVVARSEDDIPRGILKAADAVVVGDLDDPAGAKQIQAQIAAAMEKIRHDGL